MRTLSKSIFAVITIVSLMLLTSCEESQETELEFTLSKVEMLENGKWLLKGFEESVMYAFADGERATYYGENNVFSNEPIPGKHAYSFQDDKITINFNFGNIATYEIKFSCDNNIVELYDENGMLNSTLYRKDSNYQVCL